ncbi:MAG: UvrB/UvrC motif-containing protein [Clostridia bacterium]
MNGGTCERCGVEPAVVYVTHVVNGQKTERRLCEACAKQEGAWPGMAVNWPAQLGQIFGGLVPGHEKAETSLAQLQCARCGWTTAHLQQTGQLGCDACYETFGPLLEPTLRRIHGAVEHGGKIPHRVGGALRAERQLGQLRDELREAIQKEEFERAAELRDQIRELEHARAGEGSIGHE